MNTTVKLVLALAAAAGAAQASAQVKLFEHDNFRGRSINADRPIADLNRAGFNDLASSAIVSGGSWELCDDADFGGQCVVLRPGRYRSLNEAGLNDRVSSIRKAGGRRGRDDDHRHNR